MFSADTLKGQSILITGGGSGLGLSMAKGFAAAGAQVAICGRTESKLQAAAQEILAAGAPKVAYAVCDVRDHAAVEAMRDKLVAELGSITGLVNNAAGNFLCPAEDLSPGGFKAVIDIVLHGSFNASHVFGRYWIENKIQGNILSIVTTYTETGSGFVLPSAAAKAGVLAMTNSLAFEWAGYGIRANSIAPGPFPTEGAWSRLVPSADAQKLMIDRVPMQRPGDHQELANLATFLMSDMARYITGACIPIDGGERLAGAEFNFVAQLMPRDQLRAMLQAMKPKK